MRFAMYLGVNGIDVTWSKMYVSFKLAPSVVPEISSKLQGKLKNSDLEIGVACFIQSRKA